MRNVIMFQGKNVEFATLNNQDEMIRNCKRLIGALERVLYAEDMNRRVHILAKELNYDEKQLEKDIRSLEESGLQYKLNGEEKNEK